MGILGTLSIFGESASATNDLPFQAKMLDSLMTTDQVPGLPILYNPQEITEFPHGFSKHMQTLLADLSGVEFSWLKVFDFHQVTLLSNMAFCIDFILRFAIIPSEIFHH